MALPELPPSAPQQLRRWSRRGGGFVGVMACAMACHGMADSWGEVDFGRRGVFFLGGDCGATKASVVAFAMSWDLHWGLWVERRCMGLPLGAMADHADGHHRSGPKSQGSQ